MIINPPCGQVLRGRVHLQEAAVTRGHFLFNFGQGQRVTHGGQPRRDVDQADVTSADVTCTDAGDAGGAGAEGGLSASLVPSAFPFVFS